ncbi:MAG TPA: hypothetical protein VGB85_30220 [Nannocystis sp.]
MAVPRARTLFLLGLLAVAPLSGCSRVVVLTASEQASFGTRTFAAPLAVTLQAAREALEGLDYSIAAVDSRGGKITTGRKLKGVQASIGLFGRSAEPLYQQFVLQLQPVGAAQTRVIAVPHKYAGERDISRERTWFLDGDQGLHHEWRSMFNSIQANLSQ